MSRYFGWTAAGLIALAVVGLLISRFADRSSDADSKAALSSATPEQWSPVAPHGLPAARSTMLVGARSVQGELLPADVIDKEGWMDCQLARGRGDIADLAVVAVPDLGRMKAFTKFADMEAPTRFSVLDATGALVFGELPFYPPQMKLGRKPSGPVIAGFGGLHMQPFRTALPERGQPLRVFMGDAVIYENDNAWLFDIASDGSSYFVVEPLGSERSSRLVISNLDQGVEFHHDLGTMFADEEGVLTYLASYTPDNRQVHFQPISEFDQGIGTHYFFSVEEDAPPHGIHMPRRGLNDQVIFMSSHEAYLFYEAATNADTLHILKSQFDRRDGLTEATAVWRQKGPEATRAVGVNASPGGDWVVFSTGPASAADQPLGDRGSMLFVLDTASGETVFEMRTRNLDAQIQRLSNVLPSQPTETDVGWFMGAFFAGDNKLVMRWLKDPVNDNSPSLFDVYDMDAISLQAQPEYRVESNEHRRNPCASEGFPGTLQVTEDGKLAYAAFE